MQTQSHENSVHAQRDWVKQLISIRQANPALQVGEVTVLGDRLRGNALVFLRHTTMPGEEALVIVATAHALAPAQRSFFMLSLAIERLTRRNLLLALR